MVSDILIGTAFIIVCCAFLAGMIILIIGKKLEDQASEDTEDQKSKP